VSRLSRVSSGGYKAARLGEATLGLDPNQKKTATAIILATLVLCALFLAQGATSLIAARYLPLAAATDDAATSKSRAPRTAQDATSFEEILKRNMFDSAQGALWPPPAPAEAEGAGEGETDPAVEVPFDPSVMPPACQGQLKLIASVYSERRPEWSFASIASGTGAPLLYRIGSTIESHEVIEILPRSVYMRPTGAAVCSMTLFAPPEDKTAAPAAPTAVAEAEGEKGPIAPIAGLTSEELAAGIEKVSESEFNIQRTLVDKVLAHQGELMRAARVVPHEQGGQVVGVKLYGIRRNSLLGEIGMQNGDLLRTINGFDMASPDTALEAYAKLRSASNLTVAVQRRGRNVNLEYHIR
jgi:general secretion pathway protein C